MDFTLSEDQQAIRTAVRDLCAAFPDAYWRKLDENHEYPTEFVRALTEGGWLACLIPSEYGGSGVGITEASIILEEINRAGGNSATAHAQMYVMGTLLRHGSEEQKRRYLPGIARGELRLQAFGVTEPNAGSETTRLETAAVRKGDKYLINGQKVFISRVQHSDIMLLLARTTPYAEVTDKTQGLSVFIVDLRAAPAEQLTVRPLDLMINHHTTQLYFQDLEIPAENLFGEEGKGFRYIIDGWNAERILVASEAIGDGRWFTDRSARYTSDRVVFGRPIGANQGVQFPIAQAYAQVEAADLVGF
jgi:acyl-CoA dehydrogenase